MPECLLLGRFHSFGTPARNDRYLRVADHRIYRPNVAKRRLADIAESRGVRLNWADSAPTGVASGRTGVQAKAVFHREREMATSTAPFIRFSELLPPHVKEYAARTQGFTAPMTAF
jgi:hypothetical protein